MKDETVKTTQNSSNITIPSLNKSFALNVDITISVQSSLKPHSLWVILSTHIHKTYPDYAFIWNISWLCVIYKFSFLPLHQFIWQVLYLYTLSPIQGYPQRLRLLLRPKNVSMKPFERWILSGAILKILNDVHKRF